MLILIRDSVRVSECLISNHLPPLAVLVRLNCLQDQHVQGEVVDMALIFFPGRHDEVEGDASCNAVSFD